MSSAAGRGGRALLAVTTACGIAALALWFAAPPAGGTNLLPNSDLSDGWSGPTGWNTHGGGGGKVTWISSADGTVFAARVEKTDASDWLGFGTARPLPCGPGAKLTISAWVRTNDVDLAGSFLYVRFFGAKFLGQEGPVVVCGASRWTRIAASVTAPAGTTACDVSLQLRNVGAAVEITRISLVEGAAADDSGPPIPEVALQPVRVPRRGAPDTDGDGLPDPVEAVLGTNPAVADELLGRGAEPTTSFQTPTGYLPENDVGTDAVIVAGNAEDALRSWAAMGYEVQVMVGFRAGDDYVSKYPEDCQTTSDGTHLTCGPGSYYMVPTERRRDIFRDYFRQAAKGGAVAACPEEPEFFVSAGYSDSFRRIFAEEYGQPWADPTSSVDARYRVEKLKGKLEHMLLDSCWDGAREVNPDSRIFLLAHSPANYSAWAINCPHWGIVSAGRVQEMVGQVWTGTARSPLRFRGRQKERTFENAYIEYASLVGLTRGTGVELWFLMDPVEDNPDLPMEDYRINYARTLCASLFFPEVSRFEVMPWPTRIFGRVPPDYATVICTVVNALGDMRNQAESSVEPARAPIATFVADSLQWQRSLPGMSDMNDFYGLCLPLVADGTPVHVAQLERAMEPGYLDAYRTLLLSYNALKPPSAATNDVIATWVRAGGELLVFGGNDAYNALSEWWTKDGYATPQDHLFRALGLDVGAPIQKAPGQLAGVAFSGDVPCPTTVPDAVACTLYPAPGLETSRNAAGEAIGFRAAVGSGTVTFYGAAPRVFCTSPSGPEELRALLQTPPASSPYLSVRRGPYLSVRALEGGSYSADGFYVDLLDPELAVRTEVRLSADQCAFLKDAAAERAAGRPALLAASAKLRFAATDEGGLRLYLMGPLGTDGVARIYTGGRQATVESAVRGDGAAVETKIQADGETALIRFPCDPRGVALRVVLAGN
jgi:hypothetical protein